MEKAESDELKPGDRVHSVDYGNSEVVSTDTCDGIHPETGRSCMLGDHTGYHRAEDGTEWLDD